MHIYNYYFFMNSKIKLLILIFIYYKLNEN